MTRGFLTVDAVTKRYSGHTALSAASFSAARGEILALLGPSGCGKTTLLNLIAGFLTPNSGQIRVAGRDLAGVPPNHRDMGMVFQNYALFPHLTVERNVAFGLEARGVPRTQRRARIVEALDRVGLGAHGARYPHELSGGQQQRVSLARALVVRPSILLLDEPLSNLDTQLRRAMAEDVREILRTEAMTAVLVTHDQEEALVIADRVLLMAGGRIEQDGTPEEVYERPRTVFGAQFMEATNFIAGVVTDRDAAGVVVRAAFGSIGTSASDAAEGQCVTVMIRPERIQLIGHAEPVPGNVTRGTVLRTNYHGTYRRLHIDVGGQELTVDTPVSAASHAPGETVRLGWSRSDSHVLTP